MKYIFVGQMKKIYLLILLLILNGSSFAKEDEPKSFALYPVPLVTNVLTVKILTKFNATTFELRNLIGKKLQEKKYNAGEEEIRFTDMSQYHNGFYVVLAKDANGKIIESIKFTINR